MEKIIKVLDKGYCRLVDHLGSDLSVVNSARVSFDKQVNELKDKDKGLISFLAEHGHTSPFRHAMLQFECYVPLMVARQHFKYIVGSSMQDNMMAWNESSRRYVTEEPEFYLPNPDEWRSAPVNKKQGSGEALSNWVAARDFTEALEDYQQQGEKLYNQAINAGIATEQARLFLPAYGLYIRYYWTASLQGVCHFINQRLAHDAQKEIQDLAKAVYELTREVFPESTKALVKQ